jgi:hypothetical protein
MGYTHRLHPDDPAAFEALWAATETQVPAALDAVEAGQAFDRPEIANVLRDLLALHMARSPDLIALHDWIWEQQRVPTTAGLARRLVIDPGTTASFRDRHFGLLPGPGGLELEAGRLAAEIYDRSVAGMEGSSFRADRMVELFRQARSVVGRGGLEIGVAMEGEFLIGDAPAQTHPRGTGGIGVLGGTPWGKASTITMPIGRRHMLGLGPRDTYLDLDRGHVQELNRRQVMTAHRFVAWHPDADLLDHVLDALRYRRSARP